MHQGSVLCWNLMPLAGDALGLTNALLIGADSLRRMQHRADVVASNAP